MKMFLSVNLCTKVRDCYLFINEKWQKLFINENILEYTLLQLSCS